MKNDYIDINELSDSREVLESKSPKAITIFIVIVFSVLIIGFIWCYFGKINTYIKANGEIRSEEVSSTISSLTSGKINSIKVIDGESVKKDDVIMTIDSDYYESQKTIINTQIDERKVKLDEYNSLLYSIKNDNNYLSKNSSLYYEYENYVLELKETLDNIDNANEQISNSIDEYDFAISQNNKLKNETNNQINEYRILIDCINNDVVYNGLDQSVLNVYNEYSLLYMPLKTVCNDLETLVSTGVATQEQINEYNETLEKITTLNNSTINNINNAIIELNSKVVTYDSNIESYKLKKEALSYKGNKEDSKQKIKNSYYINIDNTIESIKKEIINLESELSKINEALDALTIKATGDGVIVYGKDYAIGDAISTNEAIASIIPKTDSYKVMLFVPESKITEINVGQDIEYVINSISMSDYGKPTGKIESISADSFSDQTSGSKYYKVIASINNTVLINKKDKQTRTLKVGMIVEGHIITGNQTIMSYLLDKLNFK